MVDWNEVGDRVLKDSPNIMTGVDVSVARLYRLSV